MTEIGILSDTHGYMEPRLMDFFSQCSMLFHAGDIGSMDVANTLSSFKPLTAVHGNIDGADVRAAYPQIQRVNCEDIDILMTHIGGYPKRYDPKILPILNSHPPKLFIAGHSHILKVMYDKTLQLLHINPGAAGNNGIHRVKTAIRLTIDGNQMKKLEVFELPRKIA